MSDTHDWTVMLINVSRIAMRPQEVSDALDLSRIAKDHIWKVEPSCATTGEGIFEGLSWLSSNVKIPAK
jgi:ADP-ribosylation factor protein 6